MASRVRGLEADVRALLDFETAEDDEHIATLIRSTKRTLTSLTQAVEMHVEKLREQLAEMAE